MRAGLTVSVVYTAVFITWRCREPPAARHHVRPHGDEPTRLADGLDDLLGELGELLQARDALGLQPLDDPRVLVAAALTLVEAARLQQLDVVDARDGSTATW